MGIVRRYRDFMLHESMNAGGKYCPKCGGTRIWIANRPYGNGNNMVCLDCGYHGNSSELVNSSEESEGAERLEWSKMMDDIENERN